MNKNEALREQIKTKLEGVEADIDNLEDGDQDGKHENIKNTDGVKISSKNNRPATGNFRSIDCNWKTCPVNVLLSDKSNPKDDICRRCIDLGKEKIRGDRKKTEDEMGEYIEYTLK